MAFAEPHELARWLGVDFDTAETARAQLLLDIATSVIQGYTGQTISAVASESVTIDAKGATRLFLPQRPVTAVASVTADGTALTYATDYDWTPTGELNRTNYVSWGTNVNNVVVVYSHGYSTIPDDVKGVCLARAARSWENVGGDRRESLGDYAVEYGGVGGSLLDDEKQILDRYCLVAVA